MQPVRVLTAAPFTVSVSMVDARQRVIGGGLGRVQGVATAPLSTTHQDTFTGPSSSPTWREGRALNFTIARWEIPRPGATSPDPVVAPPRKKDLGAADQA